MIQIIAIEEQSTISIKTCLTIKVPYLQEKYSPVFPKQKQSTLV